MAKEKQSKENNTIKPINPEISNQKEMKIVRTFNAPKELLYKAFIVPSYLEKWWGSFYCQKSVCKLDPTVGGKISILMTMVGGEEVNLIGEFHEIIENEKIVFTTEPADNSNGEFNVQNLNTVVFKENKGKTDLILNVKMVKISGEKTKFAFPGMVKGWTDSISKLEEFVKLEFIKN